MEDKGWPDLLIFLPAGYEIVEDLEAALEQFREIAADLGAGAYRENSR
jgi:hypothetical protein